VEAHWKPQAARQHVGTAEQDSGLDRDGEGREPGRIRVQDVCEPEECRRDYERRPASPELLDPAKQDAAEQQLFHEPGQDCDTNQIEDQPRSVAGSSDPVDADERCQSNDCAEDDQARDESKAEVSKSTVRGQVVARMLAEANDDQLIDGEHDADLDDGVDNCFPRGPHTQVNSAKPKT
jgi:hypothetical protein